MKNPSFHELEHVFLAQPRKIYSVINMQVNISNFSVISQWYVLRRHPGW
jgi:hypothetical protein